MKLKIYVIIFNWTILFVILFVSFTCVLISEQGKVSFGNCMEIKNALRIYDLSWFDCMNECTLRSDCISIRYYARMKRCELDDGTVTTDTKKCCVVRAKRGDWVEEQNCPSPCGSGARCDSKTGNCLITECSVPPVVAGYVERKGNQRTVGSKMLYICPTHETADTVICLETGSWSYIPKCIVDCGAPLVQTGYITAAGGTTEGSTRTVTCDTGSGYSGGPSVITCEASGNWTTYLGCYRGSGTVGNVGDSCNYHSDCLVPHSRCILRRYTSLSGKCMCYFNTELNANTGSCDTNCAGGFANTFRTVTSTNMRYYYNATYYWRTLPHCYSLCRRYAWCLSFVYRSSNRRCYLNKMTLQQVQDGDPTQIISAHGYTVYIRQCQSS